MGGDCVADPLSISTIGGEVASCAGTSSLTRSAARQHLGGSIWEEIVAVEGNHVADLNHHRSPPSEVGSRAVLA